MNKYLLIVMCMIMVFKSEASQKSEEELFTSSRVVSLYLKKGDYEKYNDTEKAVCESHKMKIKAPGTEVELTRGDRGTWSVLNMAEAFPIYSWKLIKTLTLMEGDKEALQEGVFNIRGNRTDYTVNSLYRTATAFELANKLLRMKKNIVGHDPYEEENTSSIFPDQLRELCSKWGRIGTIAAGIGVGGCTMYRFFNTTDTIGFSSPNTINPISLLPSGAPCKFISIALLSSAWLIYRRWNRPDRDR